MVNTGTDALGIVLGILLAICGFFLVQIFFTIKKISEDISEMKGTQRVYEEKFENIEKNIEFIETFIQIKNRPNA